MAPKIAALGLHSISGIIAIIIITYINALFLSSYPTTWVPYFFAGLAATEILTGLIIIPLFKKESPRIAISFINGFVICTILFIIFLQIQWYLIPLIFSFLLYAFALIINLIAWNSVRNTFDILEFKQLTPLIIKVSSLFSIIFGFGNAVLITYFGIYFLPYVLIALFMLCNVFIYSLKPMAMLKITAKKGDFFFKYSLFNNLFIYSLLIAVSSTFVDYFLSIQLTTSFDAKQIGIFMSYFLSACNLISIILSYLMLRSLIKWKITSLLDVLPFYWVLLSLGVVLYPQFWMIVLFAAGRYIFFLNFVNLGRELMLNVLPFEIRSSSQSLVKLIAPPFANGIAAILLILFSKYITNVFIGWSVFIINIFLLIYSKQFQENYIATLKKEINLKKFNIADEPIKMSREVMEESLSLLQSSDPSKIIFGYSILITNNLTVMPSIVLQHLFAKQIEVRIEAIKIIAHFRDLTSIPMLVKLLKQEVDGDVKWEIISTLAKLQPHQFKNEARDWLKDHSPKVKAGAICILMLTEENKTEIILHLEAMLKHHSVTYRRAASHAFSIIPIENIHDLLTIAISDSDNIISGNAIEAISRNNVTTFLPNIIRRLMHGGVYYSAKKIINKNQDIVAPLLVESIIQNKNNYVKHLNVLVSALAQLSNEKIERYLYQLVEEGDVLLRQVVSVEFLNRAKNYQISPYSKNKALHYAMEESVLIDALSIAQNKYKDKHIHYEIIDRKNLAMERYLYWIGIYSPSPSEVLGLIPTILKGTQINQLKAIELVNLKIKNEFLIKKTIEFFSDHRDKRICSTDNSPERYFDSWLTQVIQTLPNKDLMMNSIQKAYILRQVKLFNTLPGEVLVLIADEIEILPMLKGQQIFAENDPPTGLYIIASGTVNILRKGTLLNELRENDFFGELALVDNAPRLASAIAQTEGTLLFMNKEIFIQITNDLPQVLRSLAACILKYLRSSTS